MQAGNEEQGIVVNWLAKAEGMLQHTHRALQQKPGDTFWFNI